MREGSVVCMVEKPRATAYEAPEHLLQHTRMHRNVRGQRPDRGGVELKFASRHDEQENALAWSSDKVRLNHMPEVCGNEAQPTGLISAPPGAQRQAEIAYRLIVSCSQRHPTAPRSPQGCQVGNDTDTATRNEAKAGDDSYGLRISTLAANSTDVRRRHHRRPQRARASAAHDRSATYRALPGTTSGRGRTIHREQAGTGACGPGGTGP